MTKHVNRGPVLVVLTELDEVAATALLRAHALAASFGAELKVLQVTRRGKLASAAELGAFCRRELPYALPDATFAVALGPVIGAAAAQARAVRAGCLVLAAKAWAAKAAERLAHDTGAMVVVARKPRLSGALVGATKLRPKAPVLEQLAMLNTRFEAPVVLVHSVFGVRGAAPQPAPEVMSGMRRLVGAAATLLPGAELVVKHRASPVQAILETARERESDFIFIGASQNRRPLFGRSIAEEVIARASRTVAVVPMATGP